MVADQPRKIRVLVVDDSATVRRMVTDALAADPEIEVVGTALDPYAAKDKIKSLNPDVLTLDLEMPRMDGLTFLRILMERHPLPVVIMSSLTQPGSAKALEALQEGAVDVLGKPGSSYSIGDLGPQLLAKVKAAAQAKIRRRALPPPVAAPAEPAAIAVAPGAPAVETAEAPAPRAAPAPRGFGGSRSAAAPAIVPRRTLFTPAVKTPLIGGPPPGSRKILLIGASTGGTEAIREVLQKLPNNLPGIAIVQHIPATFSRAFAERLNQHCAMEVREAKDGDELRPGLALVAPGNFHMMLQRHGAKYVVRITGGPMVWHQRPAVDLLFKSAAECAGPHAVATLLTGMGKDGAEGLLQLRQKGARTFAQNEESCVVYGMPRVAFELGAAERMVPLERMHEALLAGLAQVQD